MLSFQVTFKGCSKGTAMGNVPPHLLNKIIHSVVHSLSASLHKSFKSNILFFSSNWNFLRMTKGKVSKSCKGTDFVYH